MKPLLTRDRWIRDNVWDGARRGIPYEFGSVRLLQFYSQHQYNNKSTDLSCTHNDMFKLYTFARSSTAWRARLAFNLKNIKPEYVYVNLFKGEQRNQAYRSVNPNTGVPSLILPDGNILIESMAIIEFLNELYPQPNDLFPGGHIKRAKIRGFCEVINSGIHPYQNLKLLEKLEGDYKADRKKWLNEWLPKGLDTIQKMIAQHNTGEKYIFGDKVTAADVFFYPQVLNSKRRFNIDLSPYKNVQRILKNLEQIKEFQDSQPQKQKDFQ